MNYLCNESINKNEVIVEIINQSIHNIGYDITGWIYICSK